MILNASSFFGRLAPGFVVNRFGVEKILVVSVFVCAVLILSMIALKTVASVIVIAIIYGFSAGVCEYWAQSYEVATVARDSLPTG